LRAVLVWFGWFLCNEFDQYFGLFEKKIFKSFSFFITTSQQQISIVL
jgi:hypothetical protein